jgi:hypothetical protein
MFDTALHLRGHPRRAGDLVHTLGSSARAAGRVDPERRHPYDGAMPPLRPSTTLFEDAIDAPMWLENDRLTPYAIRVRRDRDIGAQIRAGDVLDRVRGWWRAVERNSAEPSGPRLQRMRRLATAAMVAIGASFGVGVSLAAFHYDGTRPVNVVTLLATLVIAQLALLVLTLLLIPRGVPGLRAIQELLEAANPGAWAASVYRRIARPSRDVAPLFGWHHGRAAAAGRFAKWQTLYWSQTAAVAFNVAAIATGVALVTFTDLAFGWSTTLQADPHTIAGWVNALSLPWRDGLPGAVPDLPLIERSQFFRLDGARVLDVGASRALTGWWAFTILAIVVYGLLPRLALWSLCVVRLRAATRALLLDDPRITALIDRMATPAIETAAREREDSRPAAALPDTTHPEPLVGAARAVIWGGSIDAASAGGYARRTLGVAVSAAVEAGGGRTLLEDQAAIELLSAGAPGSVVVFTRAWEPPLLEFLDFVAALRRALGPDASIVVSPVAEASTGVEPGHRETWARAIGRIADPRLYLETGAA